MAENISIEGKDGKQKNFIKEGKFIFVQEADRLRLPLPQELMDFIYNASGGKVPRGEVYNYVAYYGTEEEPKVSRAIIDKLTPYVDNPFQVMSPGYVAQELVKGGINSLDNGKAAILSGLLSANDKDRFDPNFIASSLLRGTDFETLDDNKLGLVKNILDSTDLPLSAETESLKDLTGQVLSGRSLKRENEQAIDNYQASLPDELARTRGELVNTLQGEATRTFNDFSKPSIQQNLNARGLLYSGDLASEFAREASSLQAPIENLQTQLIDEDYAFYKDIAHQTALRREIEASNNVADSLAFQKGKSRLRQQQDFDSAQATLARTYNENLARRQGEQALTAQNEQLRQKQEAEKRKKRLENNANAYRLGGQIVGAVGGAILAGPGAGTYAGYQAGGVAADAATTGLGVVNR